MLRSARVKSVTASTALLLFAFVAIAGYAGILAPHRPLFGWIRVVPLDIDRTTGGPVPGENNIFFLETSCALENSKTPVEFKAESGLVLSPRTACAVEAAASAHPHRSLYLVHTCAVDVQALWGGAAPDYALAVLSLPNVFLWPLNLERLLEDSPLERLPSPQLLRFYLLWKYGGTYLDNDVFVLRPLNVERDFAFAASEEAASGSVLDMSWSAAGRRLAALCLNESLLLPRVSDGSSDLVVTRALRSLCAQRRVSAMTQEHCHGVQVLPARTAFPVPAEEWRRIFSEDGAEETMKTINESLAIHMWNHFSANAKVDPMSYQPYAQISRRVCPNVIAVIDHII